MPFFRGTQPSPTHVPKSTPRAPQGFPRTPQGCLKDAPRTPKDHQRTLREPSETPPRHAKDSRKPPWSPLRSPLLENITKTNDISMIFEVGLFTFSTPFDVKKQPRSSPESFKELPREPQRTPRAPQGSPKRRPRHPRGTQGTQGTPRDPPGPPESLQNLLQGAPSDSKAPNLPPKLKKGTQKYAKMSFLRPQSYFVHSGR